MYNIYTRMHSSINCHISPKDVVTVLLPGWVEELTISGVQVANNPNVFCSKWRLSCKRCFLLVSFPFNLCYNIPCTYSGHSLLDSNNNCVLGTNCALLAPHVSSTVPRPSQVHAWKGFAIFEELMKRRIWKQKKGEEISDGIIMKIYITKLNGMS